MKRFLGYAERRNDDIVCMVYDKVTKKTESFTLFSIKRGSEFTQYIYDRIIETIQMIYRDVACRNIWNSHGKKITKKMEQDLNEDFMTLEIVLPSKWIR